jgi:hypothetical protein
MTTVFIAGSMTIKRLNRLFTERLSNIVTSNFDVVVGDADGADTSIQKALLERNADAVTVYCSGLKPRNNVGNWRVQNVVPDAEPGTRLFFTAKDLEMAKVADYGLMMWDAKSTGTLSNVLELLQGNKKCVVFVNKEKAFLTVSDVNGLNSLISVMSDAAKMKAEDKIGLSARVQKIARKQYDLSV